MDEPERFAQIKRAQFRGLGTDIDVQIVADDSSNAAKAQSDLSEVRKKYNEIEKIFSRFDAGSELSRLNGSLGKSAEASAEMLEVARRALDWNVKTDGYFDPRVIGTLEGIGYDRDFSAVVSADTPLKNQAAIIPGDLPSELLVEGGRLRFLSRMDFSGIVKGWATDIIVQFLLRKGWENFLVDSGGDMFFWGKDGKGKPWYVDVEGISAEKILLKLSNEAVATSGISKRKWEKGGERFHHLVNPKNTTAFSFELRSVTVIAKTTEEADVWAKTIFLRGKEKGRDWAKEKDIPCVILGYGGNAWVSPAMQEHLYKPTI